MNRRAFLGLSSAALAAFALDPERLLWVPGQKTYVFVGGARGGGKTLMNLSQLVAEVYDRVLRERQIDGQLFWHDPDDPVMIRQFARDAVLTNAR